MSAFHWSNLVAMMRVCCLFVLALGFAPQARADITIFGDIAFFTNGPLTPNSTIEIPSCGPANDFGDYSGFCSGTVTTDGSGNIIAGDFSGQFVENFTVAGAEYVSFGSAGSYDVFCGGDPGFCCIPGSTFQYLDGPRTCGSCPTPNVCGTPAINEGGFIADGTNIFGLGVWMNPAAPPTPEPTTLTLLGLGTIGLAGLRNKKRRQLT
jgi:hypothetical protein